MAGQIVRCWSLPDGFASLQAQARAEGFEFLDRLAARWRDGCYMDDADAALFAIFRDGEVIAIGAQTADEHDPSPSLRRIRHFYVDPAARRHGMGRTLAGALIQQGFELAPLLGLRATYARSRAFWESLGFKPVDHPSRTHELEREG